MGSDPSISLPRDAPDNINPDDLVNHTITNNLIETKSSAIMLKIVISGVKSTFNTR